MYTNYSRLTLPPRYPPPAKRLPDLPRRIPSPSLSAFENHTAIWDRNPAIEAQGPLKPRVIPLLGQLPDNWQLGVTIGVALGLIFQLVQTGVNASLKQGQADIMAKLSG